MAPASTTGSKTRPGTAGWDLETDVVVVGFGAAGATAAIEAREHGAEVLILDRWGRGGASARSAGIIYLGGGTAQQKAAGFDDDIDKMYTYLCNELDEFDNPVIREFCEQSAANAEWLNAHGVTFPMGFFPDKAVAPTDDQAGLYFSGNEKHFAPETPAIPRGHRTTGRGLTGIDMFEGLSAAAHGAGVEVNSAARVLRLITEDETVVGVEAIFVPDDPKTTAIRSSLYQLGNNIAMLTKGTPAAITAAINQFERMRGTQVRIRASKGVILSAGGFAFNQKMRASFAPGYSRSVPLGTIGDDGSGINLGRQVGGVVKFMENCGASRFIIPPASFSSGILVDGQADRICDEGMYAATLSRHIVDHGGTAWLIVDSEVRERVRRDIKASTPLRGRRIGDLLRGKDSNVLFPKFFGPINLHLNRKMADTIEELAIQCDLPVARLRDTIEHYNEAAREGRPDEKGKPADLVMPLERGPWAAVRCDLDSLVFVAPTITLGGLEVDHATQGVLRSDGSIIRGLHAAGRNAVGIPSKSYVSGLSLADCVFAGRKAGRAAANA